MVAPIADHEALRLVAIGPETDLTGWCAEQCLLGTGMALLDVLATDDGRRRVEQAQRLIELSPDVVLFTGGMEGGDNTWLAPMLDLLLAVRGRLSPHVVYAGNSQAAPLVLGLLGGEVQVLPNAYPEPDAVQFAPVRAALAALAEARQMESHPHAVFLRHALECIGEAPPSEPPVSQLLVHLGSSAVLIASRRGGLESRTTCPLGLGKGLLAAAERVDIERLARQLGRPLDRVEWLDYCGNRSLLPTYPPPASELPLLRAVAGELLHVTLADHLTLHPEERPEPLSIRWGEKLGPSPPPTVRPTQLIVGGEWLSCLTETPAQLVAILLNGLQPEGITELHRVTAAGELPFPQSPTSRSGSMSPEVKLLATAICPVGLPANGRAALTLQIKAGKQRLVVRSGEQATLDFAQGKSLEIEIQPSREVDLGAGPGRTVRRTVSGGVVGLVIDCRGRRPLPLPDHPSGENASSRFGRRKEGRPAR